MSAEDALAAWSRAHPSEERRPYEYYPNALLSYKGGEPVAFLSYMMGRDEGPEKVARIEDVYSLEPGEEERLLQEIKGRSDVIFAELGEEKQPQEFWERQGFERVGESDVRPAMVWDSRGVGRAERPGKVEAMNSDEAREVWNKEQPEAVHEPGAEYTLLARDTKGKAQAFLSYDEEEGPGTITHLDYVHSVKPGYGGKLVRELQKRSDVIFSEAQTAEGHDLLSKNDFITLSESAPIGVGMVWIGVESTPALRAHFDSLGLDLDELTGKSQLEKGGAGSGNWGHSGRPGERGGSSARGGPGAEEARGQYVSRTEAMKRLGIQHASRMNSYFKYGMPSVKEGRSRKVAWPEAKTWFDAYTAAGRGSAGILAANKAVGADKPPAKVPEPPPPPKKAAVARTPKGELRDIHGQGDAAFKSGVLKSGPRQVMSTHEGKIIRKFVSVIPQEHLDTVARMEGKTVRQLKTEYSRDHSNCNGLHSAGRLGSDIALRQGRLTNRTTIYHEIGHSVHWAIAQRRTGSVHGPWTYYGGGYGGSKRRRGVVSAFGTPSERAAKVRKIEGFFRKASKKGRNGTVSAYALTNSREYFAESYEAYLWTPNLLRSKDPGMYNFLKTDVFNGVHYG